MFLWDVVSLIFDIGDFLRDAYNVTRDWWAPFNLLQHPLNFLYMAARALINPVGTAAAWVDSVVAAISDFITSFDLEAWFTSWKQKILDAWGWFIDRWDWFIDSVNLWWETAKTWVEGIVAIATQFLNDAINILSDVVHRIDIAWTEFWTIEFPKLAKIIDITAIVDTALKTWFPFYDDLVAIWGEVLEFFADPLEWVYTKIDEFFESYW